MSQVHPILLLEINEVPWRLIDHFLADERYPHLREFFGKAETYTTETVDDGELSPWVTWPTLHRGVPATEHGIRFLGQNPQTFRGKPVWEEFRERGLSIGVCGSLQSWPPVDPGPGGFYIPDTFANDARCIPAWVEPFQSLNLRLTSENGRVRSSHLPLGLGSMMPLLRFAGRALRPRTAARVAHQLFTERLAPGRVSRRPVFQAVLLWDVFRRLYRAENPPAFASFFTNHLASAMHRYWHHVFPDDFASPVSDGPGSARGTMEFAVRMLDEMLGDVLQMRRRNPRLTVVLASSMGQAATTWDRFEGYSAIVVDAQALVSSVTGGGRGDAAYRSLAMVPQLTLAVPDDQRRTALRKSLELARTASGEPLFFAEEQGNQLSISIRTPSRADLQAGGFDLTENSRPRRITWEQAGIKVCEVEPGTAYHIPEGVLAVLGEGRLAAGERKKMPATDVKHFLLELSQLGRQTISK